MKLHLDKWCPRPDWYFMATDEDGDVHRLSFSAGEIHARPEDFVGRVVECDLLVYQEMAVRDHLLPPETVWPQEGAR